MILFQTIRRQMLTDAGRTLGFRGGKAQRSWELIQALECPGNTLNALYDFRPYQQGRLATPCY